MEQRTSRLLWSERYKTGFETCDDEHRVMFILYNDFSRALESRVSATCAATVFATLASHIRTHLAREERLLVHRGLVVPPQRGFARRSFRRIAEDIDSCLRSGAQGQQGGDRKPVLIPLRDWIGDHVAADLGATTTAAPLHPPLVATAPPGTGHRIPVAPL